MVRKDCSTEGSWVCLKWESFLLHHLPIHDVEPPIALVKLIVHGHIVLGTSNGSNRGENRAREVCGVSLNPTNDILIPSTNVGSGARIVVRGKIREDMGLGDLIRILSSD